MTDPTLTGTMLVCEGRIIHFLVISVISGLFAFWLTVWVYRDNRNLRCFFVVRAIMLVITFLPPT